MDGNEDLKSYFAGKSQTESRAGRQQYEGYLDGPILMLAFTVCLFLWIYSLYILASRRSNVPACSVAGGAWDLLEWRRGFSTENIR